ncbi:MAG: PIN domain-containing protein [Nanoarchaeota archaeon]|nr:PIN domain-containing protein [Nanoarchaeota archaeon]
MANYSEKGKTMVDACVFLRVILQEAGSDSCEESINNISSRGETLCLTPGIIHEVIKGLELDIEEELNNLNHTLISKREEHKRQMMFDHLELFNRLTKGGQILFLTDGKNSREIWEECTRKLRIGGVRRGGWDRMHLATAISNECNEFITADGPIKSEEKNIYSIGKARLKITLL